MRTLLSSIVALVGYSGATASGIWAIVEFILYLVKDRPFNWWSVWTILICGAVAIIAFIFAILVKEREKSVRNFTMNRKSRFQERLEEMAEERKRGAGKV